jgi:hypothetical protein
MRYFDACLAVAAAIVFAFVGRYAVEKIWQQTADSEPPLRAMI